jgi:hypothetical protein
MDKKMVNIKSFKKVFNLINNSKIKIEKKTINHSFSINKSEIYSRNKSCNDITNYVEIEKLIATFEKIGEEKIAGILKKHLKMKKNIKAKMGALICG